MLKIKDNVDLKELERFGFKPKYNEDTGEIYEYYRINGDKKGTTIKYNDNFNKGYKYRNFWEIFVFKRLIINHGYVKLTDDDYEILYDLIQAGLVEKVEK
mgnify:CR=1 FL=1